jgi:hypothetical protein
MTYEEKSIKDTRALLAELFSHFGGEPPAEFYAEGTDEYQRGLELFNRVREHLEKTKPTTPVTLEP